MYSYPMHLETFRDSSFPAVKVGNRMRVSGLFRIVMVRNDKFVVRGFSGWVAVRVSWDAMTKIIFDDGFVLIVSV